MVTRQKKVIEFILVLVLAALVGAIYYYPNIRVKQNVKNDVFLAKDYVYTPLPMFPISAGSDEHKYAAPSKKIMDGVWDIDDVHIYEGNAIDSPTPKMPYVVAGIVARALGSITSFFEVSDFIFPFLSVLIGFYFLKILCGSSLVAIWGVATILTNVSVGDILKVTLFNFDTPNSYYSTLSTFAEKYPSYQIVLPFTFLAYFFIYRLITKNLRRHVILTGVLVGLSSYLYFFSFLALFAQLGFLWLWYVVQKDKERSKNLFIAIFLALVVAVFYVVGVLNFMMDPGHIFRSITFGMSKNLPYEFGSHTIKLFVCLALFAFFVIRRAVSLQQVGFVLSVLIPPYVLILLGHFAFLFPASYHLEYLEIRNAKHLLLILIAAQLLNTEWLPQRLKATKLISFLKPVMMGWLILNTAQVLYKSVEFFNYRSDRYYFMSVISKDMQAAYDWINKNTPQDTVILSLDSRQVAMVPTYTGRYNYLPDMFLSAITIDDAWRRLKESFGFYGVGRPLLEEIFLKSDVYSQKIGKYFLTLDAGSYKKYFKDVKLTYAMANSVSNFFHNHYNFDGETLAEEYYGKVMAQKTPGFEPASLTVDLLMRDQMNNYVDFVARAGDTQLFTSKIDYVWFGDMEKHYTGKESLDGEGGLTVAFESPTVKLYKVKKY